MFKYNQRMWFRYTNELYFSPAYQSLSKSARNLFHCLRNELRWPKGQHKKKRAYTNNGDVSCTIVQFREKRSGGGPSLMNAGVYLMEMDILEHLDRGQSSRNIPLPQRFRQLISARSAVLRFSPS